MGTDVGTGPLAPRTSSHCDVWEIACRIERHVEL